LSSAEKIIYIYRMLNSKNKTKITIPRLRFRKAIR